MGKKVEEEEGGWGSPDNPTHTLTLTFEQVPPKKSTSYRAR